MAVPVQKDKWHTLSLLCRSQFLVFTYVCSRENGLLSGDQRGDHEREEEADGTGKDSMWHERERYWDRRVHGGWGGEEDRGEMGTGGIVQSQLSHLPSFQLQNSANQCFVPSGQLVATVLHFRFFKDYLTGSYIYIMNFSCVCPQFSSLLLPSLWILLNRSPLYIKELSQF